MKKHKLTTLFILILASLPAFAQDTSGTAIGQQRFEKLMKKKNVVVLDVRTPDEYKEGYLPGAVNYDVLDSLNFVQKIDPLDKEKKYLLYCRSGRRSGKALVMMKQMGFTNVRHLSGGYVAWKGKTEKPQ